MPKVLPFSSASSSRVPVAPGPPAKNRPFADKLQWLAGARPEALKILEVLVDRLIYKAH